MAKRPVYAGSGSNVAKEATEMKRGGKAGGGKCYKRGGATKSPFSSAGGGGATKSPFSSAAKK